MENKFHYQTIKSMNFLTYALLFFKCIELFFCTDTKIILCVWRRILFKKNYYYEYNYYFYVLQLLLLGTTTTITTTTTTTSATTATPQ